MLPDRVSNPGPLAYESGALPIALRGQAFCNEVYNVLTKGTLYHAKFLFSFSLGWQLQQLDTACSNMSKYLE